MALSNSQYDSIMLNYEHIRDYNRNLLSKRRQEVYNRLPDVQELDKHIASTSVSQARFLIEGDTEALTRLKATLKELSEKKASLLAQAGLPADYLEPVYDCLDCKDTGYITKPDGLKEKCHCFLNQEFTVLYEQSHIRNLISQESFSSLSYDYYHGEDLDHFKGAVKICHDFVQNFKQDYHNILFYGTVGTGKSFLSGCIAREILQAGHSVIYFSASELFETLARYSFDIKEKDFLYQLYKNIYECDLLIIDDLGTEVTNTFVCSQLFSCLNERHLRSKSTIISTNLGLQEIHERYSDRIFSRIVSNYFICKLTGPDIRLQKKINSKNKNEF